jgi:hypothetical protein
VEIAARAAGIPDQLVDAAGDAQRDADLRPGAHESSGDVMARLPWLVPHSAEWSPDGRWVGLVLELHRPGDPNLRSTLLLLLLEPGSGRSRILVDESPIEGYGRDSLLRWSLPDQVFLMHGDGFMSASASEYGLDDDRPVATALSLRSGASKALSAREAQADAADLVRASLQSPDGRWEFEWRPSGGGAGSGQTRLVERATGQPRWRLDELHCADALWQPGADAGGEAAEE